MDIVEKARTQITYTESGMYSEYYITDALINEIEFLRQQVKNLELALEHIARADTAHPFLYARDILNKNSKEWDNSDENI